MPKWTRPMVASARTKALLCGGPLRGGGRQVTHAWLARPTALLNVGSTGRGAFRKCIGLLDFVTVEYAMHSLCTRGKGGLAPPKCIFSLRVINGEFS
jgi:hypothetical protein